MELLDNVVFIFSYSLYLKDFLTCLLLGGVCFVMAFKLCGIRGTYQKCLKYILSMSAIGFMSNCFLMLTFPIESYIPGTTLYIIQLSLLFVAAWSFLYELPQIVFHKLTKKYDRRKSRLNVVK